MKGFSTRNIKRMLRFYKEYSDESSKVPLPMAQIELRKDGVIESVGKYWIMAKK